MISLHHFRFFRNFSKKLEGRSLCHRPTAWKKVLSFFQKGKFLKEFPIIDTKYQRFSKNFRKNHCVLKLTNDHFVSFVHSVWSKFSYKVIKNWTSKAGALRHFWNRSPLSYRVARFTTSDWKKKFQNQKCGNLRPLIDLGKIKKFFYSASTSFTTPLADPCRVSWHFL